MKPLLSKAQKVMTSEFVCEVLPSFLLSGESSTLIPARNRCDSSLVFLISVLRDLNVGDFLCEIFQYHLFMFMYSPHVLKYSIFKHLNKHHMHVNICMHIVMRQWRIQDL